MRRAVLGALLLSSACATPPPPAAAPTPLGPPPAAPAATSPPTAPNDAEALAAFNRACPTSDAQQPIRVVLSLDRDVDWKMPPEQILAALAQEWRVATAECAGADIESDEARSLSVTLPEPCGAQRISGKLGLWLVPHGGRSYATVHVDGKMGSFAVVARASVDPSDQPKTACVTAELQGKSGGTTARPTKPPPTTHGERRVTNMRLQRTLFGLFFPPLLLAPDPAR